MKSLFRPKGAEPVQPPKAQPDQPTNADGLNLPEKTQIELPKDKDAELSEKTFGSDISSKRSTFASFFGFFISWIAIPLLVVFLFQAWVFQAFYVSGQSMEPTFQNGDYLVISKIGATSRNFRKLFNKKATLNYKRGDVLIFHPPISSAENTFFIKRLIGLPGERVVIHDGKITIYNKDHPEGLKIEESYDPSAITSGDYDKTIDSDKFFVLGDNREPNGSYDSRAWGQLPQDNVSGRVVIRLLPINRFMFVPRQTYSLLLPQNLFNEFLKFRF